MGTAFRMFLLLALALLPLAFIALVSTLGAVGTADRQKQELLRAAAEQSAGKLDSTILSVQTAQSLTVNSMAQGVSAHDACAPMLAFLRSGKAGKDAQLLITGRNGTIRCSSGAPGGLRTADALAIRGQADLALTGDARGLLVRNASRDGSIIAATLYRADRLGEVISPPQAKGWRRVTLTQDSRQLVIASKARDRAGPLDQASAPVGDSGLKLTLEVARPPRSLLQNLSLFSPLIMWATAALLGWLAVRWMMIQPLVALRRAVADYQPGETLMRPRRLLKAPREVAELGETFQHMSEQVAAHDEEIYQTLEQQKRLTREVHHRVKNNLQIISSLINLHARAATDESAAEAYISIQRRVDALAVVQRNHYAELEAARGVSACPLITEIAASLRNSILTDPERFSIQIDCDPLHLHQDVAAPVAFLIAELADFVISAGETALMSIALHADLSAPGQAMLRIRSDAFRSDTLGGHPQWHFHERVLTGLSRQLRAPLEHDCQHGEYRIRLSTI